MFHWAFVWGFSYPTSRIHKHICTDTYSHTTLPVIQLYMYILYLSGSNLNFQSQNGSSINVITWHSRWHSWADHARPAHVCRVNTSNSSAWYMCINGYLIVVRNETHTLVLYSIHLLYWWDHSSCCTTKQVILLSWKSVHLCIDSSNGQQSTSLMPGWLR